MLRQIVFSSCLAGLLAIGQLALAQEFSADVVNLQREGGLSKMYVGKDKVRMEMKEKSGNGGMNSGALIIDTVQKKNIVLMAERQMYMELPQGQMTPMAQNFWRPPDPDDACPQWKEMAAKVAERSRSAKQLTSCRKVGTETLNGRSAIKYEGTSSDGKTGNVWVDSKLRFVVKTLGSEGNGFELRNIQEGSQPASLFEVPAGYTKFDMGGMMQQRPQ